MGDEYVTDGKYRVKVSRVKTSLVYVDAETEREATEKAINCVKGSPNLLKYTQEWRGDIIESPTEVEEADQ